MGRIPQQSGSVSIVNLFVVTYDLNIVDKDLRHTAVRITLSSENLDLIHTT